jgi:predicted transcriptional regulator
MSSGLKYSKININLRRSEVLSLLARGLQQQEIGRRLGVSDSLISLDVQCIKETAADELQHHISEIVPFHYKIVMQGFRDILLAASTIVQNSADDRTKLSALGLMANIYDRILAVDTNGPIISAAVGRAKNIETTRLMLKEMEIEQDPAQVQEEEPEEDQD